MRKRSADLTAFGEMKDFAGFLASTAAGLKHEQSGEPDYRAASDRSMILVQG